jgi:excinuclease ABC subunit C
VPLTFSPEIVRIKSLDQELRERLSDRLQCVCREGSRIEQLAIFSRWYYSSWRDGPWFPFRSLADLNYRKLVREISAMVKS